MEWAAVFSPFNITLAIIVVASVFFMRGKVRSDLVAMCALLMLLVSGVLDPEEALAGFSSPIVLMMAGLFIVGAGIFRTGLAKMISSKILKLGNGNETLLFILVMLVTASVGAFVSNTGTVAVMMPIVISMAASSGISTKRYLMPMAFASSLGMFTLISTPPNLVIQNALREGGFEPLRFFSFAPVGFIAVGVGVVVLIFLSKLLVSDKKEDTRQKKDESRSLSDLVEEYRLSGQIFRIAVGKGSRLIGKTLEELKLPNRYNVVVGMIVRKPAGSIILGKSPEEIMPEPGSVIHSEDVLFCYGNTECIKLFTEENGLQLEDLNPRNRNYLSREYGIAEVFVTPESKLINKTVRESRFREKFNVNVLGIKHRGADELTELKNTKIKAGDALLIYGTWDEIAGLSNRHGDLILVGQPEKEAAKVTLDRKAPLAAIIMLAMIAVMVLDVVDSVTAVLAAAVVMVITGCLRNMEEAYNSINWNSVVLLAAMIPMATAFNKTGITEAISGGLLGSVGNMGPHMLLAVIYLCTSLLTMFLSNTATAVLFAPIAMQAAIGMGVSPYPFLFAVAVGAGMCFASPFSTAPNAIVMGAGHYSFMDYIRVGLPLQLIMAVVMILLLPLIFPF